MLFKHIPKKALLLFAGDVLLISLAFSLSPAIREGYLALRTTFSLGWAVNLFIYLFVFYLADLYGFDLRFKSAGYFFRYVIAVSIAWASVTTVFYFAPYLTSGRGAHLINAALVFVLVYFWRRLFERSFAWIIERPKRLLILGAGKAGGAMYEAVKGNPGFKVVGFIDDDPAKHGVFNSPRVFGGSAEIPEVLRSHDVNSVVMAISYLKNSDLVKNIFDCKMSGVQVYDMPSLYEEVTGKVPVEHINDLWFVNTPLYGVRKNVYNQKLKRVMDISLSSMGLLLSLPIAVVAAASVRLESRGPVFFRQRRIGLDGKPFTLVKFRTMKEGTESHRQHAGRHDDPRITKVGKLLRLARLDEIPQMWNVLKGEMSFIGPRALMEEEVKQFKSEVPYFALRHSIRPGITGWAQVNYRHGATVRDALEKLQYDLYYIKNLSPLLDMSIILRTVKVVMFGKGAR